MKEGCSVKYPSVCSNFIHDVLNQSFWERQAITWSHDGGDSSSIHFQTKQAETRNGGEIFLFSEILVYFLIFVLVGWMDGWTEEKVVNFPLTFSRLYLFSSKNISLLKWKKSRS